jgi:predicted phosphoribosyltransferase
MLYDDRRDAGRTLAAALLHYRDRRDVVVLALPRGGVPVAFEVAEELRTPLDVFLVRKLGLPGNEEYAIGAGSRIAKSKSSGDASGSIAASARPRLSRGGPRSW